MAIRPETELLHDVLGPMRFDDGQPLPWLDQEAWQPQWVARPDGWDSDLEYHLAGGACGPDPSSLERAVRIFGLLEYIETQAREISGLVLELAWVDCKCEAPVVALTYAPEVYSVWEGTLDDQLRLTKLTARQR